jgi:tetratricopeptide (TPR) repeat protein
LSETEKDATFLETYAEALMRSEQLDAARAVLERMTNQGAGSPEKFFSLASEFLRAGQEEKAVNLLSATKKSMLAARRESEFSSAVDQLVEAFPKSLPLAQFWGAYYAEINRESKYFDALVRLFDLNMANDQLPGACEALEKLVEIDPYDSRNQGRLDLMKGRASEEFLSRVKSRLSNVATHRPDVHTHEQLRGKSSEPSPAILGDVQSGQTLEDMLVQAGTVFLALIGTTLSATHRGTVSRRRRK